MEVLQLPVQLEEPAPLVQEEPKVEQVILPRLEFNRTVSEVDKDYLSGASFCSHAMQGKIFYKYKDMTYTQSRDDIPKRMYIRGEELEKESYLPLFEIFDSITEKYDDLVVVLMVSRQDLLITHREMEGTQIFFLGCIVSEHGFIPSSMIVENHEMDPRFEDVSQLVTANEIKEIDTYKVPNQIYIPAKISDPETLQATLAINGSFIHTCGGVPTTISSIGESQVFEYFSNTQNNKQLFVRLFFMTPFEDGDEGPTSIEDVEKRVEIVAGFSPRDKTAQFVELVERFRHLIDFFYEKKVCFGIVQNNKEIFLEHDSIDDREMKIMEKPLKSLNTFLKNIKNNLRWNRKNGVAKGVQLGDQIRISIFSFFKYVKNVNNCCHLLKHVERLSIR